MWLNNVGATSELKPKTNLCPKKQGIWVHALPVPSDIGLISVSVRGRTQGSPLYWFRTLVGFRFFFEASFSPNQTRPIKWSNNS